MAGKAFLPALARPPREALARAALTCLWLVLSSGCGSTPQQRDTSRGDAGLFINVPDTGMSCPDAASGGSSATSTCVPQAQRDFSTEIQPLFAGCAGDICHSFDARGLHSLIGLASLECCSEASLIVPGFPERSYLLDKLRGAPLCSGVRMPIDKPPLGDDQIQAISDWICEGAPTQ